MTNFNLDIIQNLILIGLCTASCLYCLTLSHRLKRLNNLKSGVGASILSLTQAIQDTHNAARETQSSLIENMQSLRHLVERAEATISRIEAKSVEIETQERQSKKLHDELTELIQSDLPTSIKKATDVGEGLLSIVSDISQLKRRLDQQFKRAYTAENIAEFPAKPSRAKAVS